jgi:hypothetical protein
MQESRRGQWRRAFGPDKQTIWGLFTRHFRLTMENITFLGCQLVVCKPVAQRPGAGEATGAQVQRVRWFGCTMH